MPELKIKYANTISQKCQAAGKIKTNPDDACPRCGHDAAPFREYVHPNYGITMQEWICPRCRHIWVKKKGE